MNGGKLWMGSSDCPISSKIAVTFYGLTQNPKTLPPISNANKGLLAYGGAQIDIHGNVPFLTWTVITATTRVGATSISVRDTVSWPVGSQIVIATTDFTKRNGGANAYVDSRKKDYGNSFRSEVVTISSINGNTINFSPALNWTHYGKIWQPDDTDDTSLAIDMRAEVGLLTRNIVFRGDITEGTTAADKWGGHVMVTDQCNARIVGVEFYHMGQKDNVARYPVHYHLCGNVTDSYVSKNSFHDTFQRAITIHGSNNIKIEYNVGFNVDGHMFFVEDGDEQGNEFRGNLGIQTNPHTLLDDADMTPAIFWITSAKNHWVDNVAVAGYFGFWFSFPKHPLGLAQVPTWGYWNRYDSMGNFANNKAHSCTKDGLHIDNGLVTVGGLTELSNYRPVEWEKVITEADAQSLFLQPSGWTSNKLEETFYSLAVVPALIKDFTAYKCIEHGVWCRGTGIWLVNAKVADNQIGCQFPGDKNMVQDSIIVGETDNTGLPDPDMVDQAQGRDRFYRWSPQTAIVGHQHYDGGSPDILMNVKFYNFVDYHFLFNGKIRPAGAIRVTFGASVIAPGNKYLNVGFHRTPNHVRFNSPAPNNPNDIYQGYDVNARAAIVIDFDGSLTGVCGSSVVYPEPMLYTSQCTAYPTWNAYVCPPGKPYRKVTFQDNDATLFTGMASDVFYQISGTLYRLPDYVSKLLPSEMKPQYSSGTGEYLSGTFYRNNHQYNIMVHTSYILTWGSDITPKVSTITLADLGENEWVRFGIPYPDGTTFTFDRALKQVTSLSELDAFSYFYDSSTKLLWIHFESYQTYYRYDYGIISQDGGYSIKITATCPSGVCTQPISVNDISVTGQEPLSTVINLCQKPEADPFGGQVTFTPTTGGNSFALFTEDFGPEWNSEHYSWLAPWEVTEEIPAASGTKSLKFYVKQQGFSFWRLNKQVSYPGSDYTHFQFKIRVAAGRGQWSIGVNMQNKTGQNINDNYFRINSVNSPEYCSTCPIDDNQWHTITIPLSDLGVGSDANLYNEIWQVSFWPSNWESINTTVYMDDLIFVHGQTSYNLLSLDDSNINTGYNYAEDSYTKDPLQNIQIPGAPSATYGSCPETSPNCNINNNYLWLGSNGPIDFGNNVPDNLEGGPSGDSSSGLTVGLGIVAALFVVAAIAAIILGIKLKKSKDFV